jgi:hypothetical protein
MAVQRKSHLMRVAAIEWCQNIPQLQVYLFRRICDDLIKNHMEGRGGFRALLAPLVLRGEVEIVESEIRFLHNGSRIFLCHCEHEKHIYKYQGSEMDVLLIDEANGAARKAHERDKRATETRLRGWACKIRTQKRRRKLSL